MKLPLYQKVANELLELIRSGEIKEGERLPPDEALQERYAASRITIQRALDELKDMGLLRRVRGHGSFIQSQARTESAAAGEAREPLRFISVFFPQGESNGAHNILLGIEEQFFDTDYIVGIKNSRDSFRAERVIMENLLAQRPSGVILYPTIESYKNTDLVSRFIVERIPLVVIDRKFTYASLPFVSCDNRLGSRTLVDFLVGKGRRRIAFLGSSLERISSEQERFDGYCQGLSAASLSVDMDLVRMVGPYAMDNYQRPETDAAVGELVAAGADAVVAVNDFLAIAVSRSLRGAGVEVPGRISVVGFDDIDPSRYDRPSITTYRQPFREIGRRAAGMLRDIMEGKLDPAVPTELRVKGSLIPRDSA